MTEPVNHRERIEGWMRDALAMRGTTVGYWASVNDGPPLGWTVGVTMRHPAIGQGYGDLHVEATTPVFTLTREAIAVICEDALGKLDAKAAEIRPEMLHGGRAPGHQDGAVG
jgi:hypothetical protein